LSNISFVNQAEIPFPSGSGQPKFSAVHLSSWAPTVVVVVVALPATVVVVVIATSATVVVVISSSGIVVVVVTSATLVVVIVVDVVDVDRKPDDVDVGSGVGGVPHWQNSGGQKGTALLQLAVHHWSVA